MKYLFIFLICFSVQAQQIEIIKKGQIAPFDGFVVDSAQMKVFREYKEKTKLLTSKNLVLSDLQVTYKDMVIFHKARANRANSELQRAYFKSDLKAGISFALGALLSGFIAIGLQKGLR